VEAAYDYGEAIAVDGAGSAYITGTTYSADFPTKNPFQGVMAVVSDAFVAKFNPAGSDLVYSTYLGGNGVDGASGIALDSAGNAYITGLTCSTDFPTMNPLQPTYHGGDCSSPPWSGDAFVTKLNSTGSHLIYSTYLGGSLDDYGWAIAVDNAGSAYITGWAESHDFPLENPVQKRHSIGSRQPDAFLSKINPAGSAFVFSSYLGGKGIDQGQGIAVDSAGHAYVVGITTSTDFPVTRGAFQTVCESSSGTNGCQTAFVSKIDVRSATTITLLSSVNPSGYGQAVNFTAVVSSNAGALPDGETVTFKRGKTVIGTGTFTGGSASFTTSTLPVGLNSITALYGGDSNFINCASKVVKQTVNKAATTTTLASSQNPSSLGQPVTFTASVTSQFSGTVHGTVTFYDGPIALKTASLSGGAAKFTTSTLTSGTHSITATYNGSTSFTGSSVLLTQTVN